MLNYGWCNNVNPRRKMSAMNEKILVIEDEEALVETLRYNLAREGYQVYTATDGMSGLELARSEKPDLIILCSPNWTASRSAASCVRKEATSPSSCSPAGMKRWTKSWAWSWAPTIT